jgi:hypothetical protein
MPARGRSGGGGRSLEQGRGPCAAFETLDLAQGTLKLSGREFQGDDTGSSADRRFVRPWARRPRGRSARGPGLWVPVQPQGCDLWLEGPVGCAFIAHRNE